MPDWAAISPRGNLPLFLLSAAIVAAALLGGGYFWLGRGPPSGPPEQVTIASIVYPGACPLVVAQAKGLFAEEALNVKLDTYPNGKAALDAVSQSKASLAASGDIPVMFAAMERQSLSIVATIATSENDLGIVGRKDRGISLPASLKGKTIGVTLGTGGHFVLDAFLTRQKLTASDVTVHDLNPEELSGALASGDIDAASVWQPFLGALQNRLGPNGETFLSGGIYDVAFTLAGTSGYVVSHPETIKKVLRALIRADRFCKDSPGEARNLVAKTFDMSAADLTGLWPAYRFEVALEQGLLLALEDESQWAIKNKLTASQAAPNYWKFLYLDALEAVAPAKVTVIH